MVQEENNWKQLVLEENNVGIMKAYINIFGYFLRNIIREICEKDKAWADKIQEYDNNKREEKKFSHALFEENATPSVDEMDLAGVIKYFRYYDRYQEKYMSETYEVEDAFYETLKRLGGYRNKFEGHLTPNQEREYVVEELVNNMEEIFTLFQQSNYKKETVEIYEEQAKRLLAEVYESREFPPVSIEQIADECFATEEEIRKVLIDLQIMEHHNMVVGKDYCENKKKIDERIRKSKETSIYLHKLQNGGNIKLNDIEKITLTRNNKEMIDYARMLSLGASYKIVLEYSFLMDKFFNDYSLAVLERLATELGICMYIDSKTKEQLIYATKINVSGLQYDLEEDRQLIEKKERAKKAFKRIVQMAKKGILVENYIEEECPVEEEYYVWLMNKVAVKTCILSQDEEMANKIWALDKDNLIVCKLVDNENVCINAGLAFDEGQQLEVEEEKTDDTVDEAESSLEGETTNNMDEESESNSAEKMVDDTEEKGEKTLEEVSGETEENEQNSAISDDAVINVAEEYDAVCEGTWLKDEQGNDQIQLKSKIGTGGEGDIYEIQTPGMIAKIFHSNINLDEKKQKIETMLEIEIKDEKICWPQHLLFTYSGKFVGYLMPRAKGKTLAATVCKPQKGCVRGFPKWNRRDLVIAAQNMVETFGKLHEKTITMGDVNPGNIMVDEDKNIYFVDTDSYQISSKYLCTVGMPLYTSPRIHEELKKEHAKNFTIFRKKWDEIYAMTVLIFQILFVGQQPFLMQGDVQVSERIINGDFPFRYNEKNKKDTPVGTSQYIWSHIDYNIKKFFCNAFIYRNYTEEKDWIEALAKYSNRINDGKSTGEIRPHTFKEVENGNVFVSCICSECKKEFNVDRDFYEQIIYAGGKVDKCKECRSDFNLRSTLNTKMICSECGEIFLITQRKAAIEFAEKQRNPLCPKCRNGRNKTGERTTGIEDYEEEEIDWTSSGWKKGYFEKTLEELEEEHHVDTTEFMKLPLGELIQNVNNKLPIYVYVLGKKILFGDITELYELALNNHEPAAKLLLDFMDCNGNSVQVAKKYFEQYSEIENGKNDWCMEFLAEAMIENGDYKGAEKILQPLAEKENVNAQLLLMGLYSKVKNTDKLRQWTEKAISNRSMEAMYSYYQSIKKDSTRKLEAETWLNRSAQQGYYRAKERKVYNILSNKLFSKQEIIEIIEEMSEQGECSAGIGRIYSMLVYLRFACEGKIDVIQIEKGFHEIRKLVHSDMDDRNQYIFDLYRINLGKYVPLSEEEKNQQTQMEDIDALQIYDGLIDELKNEDGYQFQHVWFSRLFKVKQDCTEVDWKRLIECGLESGYSAGTVIGMGYYGYKDNLLESKDGIILLEQCAKIGIASNLADGYWLAGEIAYKKGDLYSALENYEKADFPERADTVKKLKQEIEKLDWKRRIFRRRLLGVIIYLLASVLASVVLFYIEPAFGVCVAFFGFILILAFFLSLVLG